MAFAVCFLLAPADASAASIGKITATEGKVDILREGKLPAIDVKIGDSVFVKDVIRTKSSSKAEITFNDASILKIAQRSRIDISEYISEGGSSKTVIDMQRGKVNAEVSKATTAQIAKSPGANKFEIRTPSAIAGVRGTNYFVFYTGNIITVLVTEGTVVTYNPKFPDVKIEVKAGQMTTIAENRPPMPPKTTTEDDVKTHQKDVTPEKEKKKSGTFSFSSESQAGTPTAESLQTSLTELQTSTENIMATLQDMIVVGVDVPVSEIVPEVLGYTAGFAGFDGFEGTLYVSNSAFPEYCNYNCGNFMSLPWDRIYPDELTLSGSIQGLLSGSASLWSGSAPFSATGTYSNPDNRPLWYAPLIGSTTDGGAFRGFTLGITMNNALEGMIGGIYIKPDGTTGYIYSNNVLGNADPASGTWGTTGNITSVQMGSTTYLPADLLSDVAFDPGCTGSCSQVTRFGGAITGKFPVESAEIIGQNWGVFYGAVGGSYPVTPASNWTAKLGIMDYYNSILESYCIADISGTGWSGNRVSGLISGKTLGTDYLGTAQGQMLGTYNASYNWQALTIGTYTDTPLTYVNSLTSSLNYIPRTGDGSLTSSQTVPQAGDPWSIVVDPTGRFAYGINYASGNNISLYTIDRTTGQLTSMGAIPVSTGRWPLSIAVDPTGRFAYVTDDGASNNVSMYTINQTTGQLTPAGAISAGASSYSIAVDPTGRFAYVTNYNSNNVSMYTINQTTGQLIPMGVISTGSTTNPWPVAFDPTGRFAYVGNKGASNIDMFMINQVTGQLTPMGSVLTSSSPESITVDPTGRFAYVANYWTSDVSMYTINQTTGQLTLTGSVTISGATPRPRSVAVDPTGRFVYVASEGVATISMYAINQVTGQLTRIGSGTVPSGTIPNSVAFDPTGRFAYVANRYSGFAMYTIDQFMQASDGLLTALMGGTTSLWSATQASPAPVTMMGEYVLNGNSAPRIFGTEIYSRNYDNSTNTTYDGGAYRGIVGGGIANNIVNAGLFAIYVDLSGNAGVLKGWLSGNAYPDISMFEMNGAVYPAQIATAAEVGVTAANLYNSIFLGTTSTGDFLFSGGFNAGGIIRGTMNDGMSYAINGQNWGIAALSGKGVYTGDVSDSWKGVFSQITTNAGVVTSIHYMETSGTLWSNNLIKGSGLGYYADVGSVSPPSPPSAGIMVGETFGVFNPADSSWQALSATLWMDTVKFLDMTVNNRAELQKLNIPAVEVGRANLTGSGNNMTVTMRDVIFFAPNTGQAPGIWATGNVSGSYGTSTPIPGNPVALSGNGLNATFTPEYWSNNSWLAAVNGGGTYSGTGTLNGNAVQMKGAGAGTYTGSTSGTFTGTAAGTAK